MLSLSPTASISLMSDIETAARQILLGCSALSPFLEFSSTQGVVL